MVRRLVPGMLGVVLAWVTARALGEEPPPLTPPAELPSSSLPHPSTGAPAPGAAGPQPVLAVPGFSRPGPSSSRPAASRPVPENGAPPLTGPAGAPVSPDVLSSPMPPGAGAPPPRIGRFDAIVPDESGGLPGSAPRPERESGPPALTLEPVPADRLKSQGIATPAPVLMDDEGPAPSRSAAPPRRSWFGRLAPPAGARSADDEPIRVTPRSDPATEAALKRRLEAQIRTAAGPQLRTLNVRVAGRTVQIQARVYHFWQRRLVRRSIESLPHPPGYQTRIEVTD